MYPAKSAFVRANPIIIGFYSVYCGAGELMEYETIKVVDQGFLCSLEMHRPSANNTINDLLVEEFHDALSNCENAARIVVLRGLPDVFCFGLDFQELVEKQASVEKRSAWATSLYDLWLKLATAPYVTISQVRGKANAGGLGFVTASDIVLADRSAQFSLSEMLFGLYPACVFPFLVRRVGFQRAKYLTLTTQSISAERAREWGLVDEVGDDSDMLVRRYVSRMRHLSKAAIARFKSYANQLCDPLAEAKDRAVSANVEMFCDAKNIESIVRYVERGEFPWE